MEVIEPMDLLDKVMALHERKGGEANMVECRQCGKSDKVAWMWQMRADQVPVIRVECLRCVRFMRWASRTPEHMELADRRHGHPKDMPLFPEDDSRLRNGRNG